MHEKKLGKKKLETRQDALKGSIIAFPLACGIFVF